ncbi:unnamed protein product [Polarella glacialis]|uniref:C3H1-type domain-containing protein n=1 Tax=Polarella glacialis TaxID=89957 RepID=A0A813IFS2_POLGL|nr:unnamed protein product [Polarella glacialis]
MLVPAQDVVSTFQLQRPGLSYTTAHRLITDLSRKGYWSNVLAILQELTSVRLRLNIITLGAAVNVFSRAPTSTWTQALGLLRAAGAQGFERSTFVQNSVLNALHKAGAWELCLELLLRSWPPELGDSEQQPDIYSYTSTLSACGSGRQWTAALGLLQLAQRRGLILSPVAGSAAMVALEGSGQWRQALDVFDQLRSSDVQVDEPVCNSAIEVLAEGSWAFSLALLRVMPDWRLSPNLVSYIAALTACGRAQRWKSSLQLLQKASSNGLKLNEVSCGAAVSACSQGRAWQVSLGIFGEMTYRLSLEVGERGHKPLCIITYDVALGACLAGQRWEASLELLRSLLQQGVQPSTVTLTALVSNRAHQSQWARAEELLARLAVQRSALNLGNEARFRQPRPPRGEEYLSRSIGPTRSSLQRSKSWGGSSSDRESSYSSSAVNFPVWQPILVQDKRQLELKILRSLDKGGSLHREDVAGGAERADWSLGSEQHASGECKPCLFVKSPNGCKHGLACSYCHVSHHEGQHRNRRVRPCKTTRDRCKKKIGELCSIIGSDSAAPEQIPAKLQQDCQLLLGRSHYSRRLVQAQQEEVFSLLGFGAGSSSSSAVAELCQTGKLSL